MALVSCPECKGKVSESASLCPHCGYELAVRKPTRHAGTQLVRFSIALAVVVTGCVVWSQCNQRHREAVSAANEAVRSLPTTAAGSDVAQPTEVREQVRPTVAEIAASIDDYRSEDITRLLECGSIREIYAELGTRHGQCDIVGDSSGGIRVFYTPEQERTLAQRPRDGAGRFRYRGRIEIADREVRGAGIVGSLVEILDDPQASGTD